MVASFQSFQRSPLGAFVQSPLKVRNAGGNLLLGGRFTFADGNSVDRITILKNNELVPIIDETPPGPNGAVNTVIEYKGDLYLGGEMTGGIVKLNKDTKAYDIVDGGVSGLESTVHNFTIFNGLLILVGGFDSAGTAADTNQVAAFNGTSFQTMFSQSTGDPRFLVGRILETTVFKSELYVCGTFWFFEGGSQVPGSNRFVLAKFTGSDWDDVHEYPVTGKRATSFSVFEGELWMGGFIALLQKFPGGATITVTGNVQVVRAAGGKVFVGGSTLTVVDGVSVQSVASFDSVNGWQAVGDGFTGSVSDINDFIEHKGEIYLAGAFTTVIDGDSIDGLIKLDEKNNVWVKASSGAGPNNLGSALFIAKKL